MAYKSYNKSSSSTKSSAKSPIGRSPASYRSSISMIPTRPLAIPPTRQTKFTVKPLLAGGALIAGALVLMFVVGSGKGGTGILSGIKNGLSAIVAPGGESQQVMKLRQDIKTAKTDVENATAWLAQVQSARAMYDLGDPASIEMARAVADALERLDGSRTETEMIENSLRILQNAVDEWKKANVGGKFRMLRQALRGASEMGATLDAADRETLVRNARKTLDLAQARLQKLTDEFVALTGYAP